MTYDYTFIYSHRYQAFNLEPGKLYRLDPQDRWFIYNNKLSDLTDDDICFDVRHGNNIALYVGEELCTTTDGKLNYVVYKFLFGKKIVFGYADHSVCQFDEQML